MVIRFCSKCGASVPEHAERCPMCRAPVGGTAAAVAAASIGADRSPLVGMWLNPRQTVREIVSTDPSYFVVPLAAAGGVLRVLDRAAGRNAGDHLPLAAILALAAALGAAGGVAGLYIAARLLEFTGKWLGGTGTREEIRAAVAWGAVPNLCGGLLWIPILALTGGAFFGSSLDSGAGGIAMLLSLVLMIVQVGTAIWSMFTTSHAVGEVQGFSAWKAAANGLVAGLVILVPIVVVAVAVVALLR